MLRHVYNKKQAKLEQLALRQIVWSLIPRPLLLTAME